MSADAEPFYASLNPDAPLSQGDVLLNVLCLDAKTAPAGARRTVMVVTYSCELDKPNNPVFHVAVCSRFTREKEPFRDRIRAGHVTNVMHLPDHGALAGEGYVDFRAMFRVQFSDVDAELRPVGDNQYTRVIRDPSIRVIALSERGVLTLRGHLARFFGFGRADIR